MSSSQTRAVPEWLSWANMLAACRRACAGKRTRPSVARFLLQQEDELVRLRVHRRIDPRFRVGVKREVALPRVVRGVG
jgi:hypothetical protein